MTLEDDFVRAQKRARLRGTIWVVAIVASLLLVWPAVIIATSHLGSTGYVVGLAPLLIGYGVVRLLFTKGRW